jgi:hypothetical protein
MRQQTIKLFLILIVLSTSFNAQNTEINRLVKSELEMTFPSIYFKNNSTDYAKMPYTVDSCLKYIAENLDDIVSYTIWRDSNETDQLTKSRIKKIKANLKKYTPGWQIEIQSMGKEQKISRRTIDKGADKKQIQYLLSLNSVLDISKTAGAKKKWKNRNHVELPRPWCWGCIKSGFHTKRRMQMKRARRSKQQ